MFPMEVMRKYRAVYWKKNYKTLKILIFKIVDLFMKKALSLRGKCNFDHFFYCSIFNSQDSIIF